MSRPSAAFQVNLLNLEPGEDVLGVWQARLTPGAQPRQRAHSFDASAMGGKSELGETDWATVWQVDLPRDPRQAVSLLSRQERRLAQAEQALPLAEQRLERYIEVRRRGAGSFALSRRDSPEASLDAWPVPGGAVTSGSIQTIPDDWEAIARQANSLLKRLGQAATYVAWVETSVSGKLVGRTTVTWDGDLRHFWLYDATANQAVQHQRSLALALRTRLAWVKMAVLALSGGFKLAVLYPVDPLAAIPLAFQFFRQIIAQAQEIQSVRSKIASSA